MENSATKVKAGSNIHLDKVMVKYIIFTCGAVLLGMMLFAYGSEGGETLRRKISDVYTTFHTASEVAAVVVGVGVLLGGVFVVGAMFVCFVIILSVLEIIFRPQTAVLGVRPRFARMVFGSLGEKYNGLR